MSELPCDFALLMVGFLIVENRACWRFFSRWI